MKKPSFIKSISRKTALALFGIVLILIAGILFFTRPSYLGRVVVGTRVVVLLYHEAVCSFTLESGLNLVSFPCLPNTTPVADFMEQINSSGAYSAIFTYDSSDSADPWKAYNPSLPGWVVQDLAYIDRQEGYWIQATGNRNITLNASVVYPNLILLRAGWNLVGYPTLVAKDVNESLVSIYPQFQLISMYNRSGDEWMEYTWNQSIISNQKLKQILPYYGYWIYMNTTDEWEIVW